jgi:chromosome segregation ATPase
MGENMDRIKITRRGNPKKWEEDKTESYSIDEVANAFDRFIKECKEKEEGKKEYLDKLKKASDSLQTITRLYNMTDKKEQKAIESIKKLVGEISKITGQSEPIQERIAELEESFNQLATNSYVLAGVIKPPEIN